VSEQGASASLTDFILTLNYGGVQFFGSDRVTVGVCDLSSECSEEELTIEVSGDVIIYNAISPNGDASNDTFIIQYINILPETQSNKVTIYNRWGDVVFEISNYDNQSRVFTGMNKNGNELPSGTYFYKLEFASGRRMKTGFLSLKR
jgi:gliding motility-associated-like protein